jgi:hypothetical protein
MSQPALSLRALAIRRRPRRGIFMLGLAGFLALLSILCAIVLARTSDTTQQTALLRWRLGAQHLAEGGIDSARAGLAAQLQGGRSSADAGALPSGAWTTPQVGDCRWRVLPATTPNEWIAEADASAPATARAGYTCRLRARLAPDPAAPGQIAVLALEWATPSAEAPRP